jgi:hypothetical protein
VERGQRHALQRDRARRVEVDDDVSADLTAGGEDLGEVGEQPLAELDRSAIFCRARASARRGGGRASGSARCRTPASGSGSRPPFLQRAMREH